MDTRAACPFHFWNMEQTAKLFWEGIRKSPLGHQGQSFVSNENPRGPVAGSKDVHVDRSLHGLGGFFEIEMKARIASLDRRFQRRQERGTSGPWGNGDKLPAHDARGRKRNSSVRLPVLENKSGGVHVNGPEGNFVGDATIQLAARLTRFRDEARGRALLMRLSRGHRRIGMHLAGAMSHGTKVYVVYSIQGIGWFA